MGLADWFRRHRWLISYPPEVDAPGEAEESVRKEYDNRSPDDALYHYHGQSPGTPRADEIDVE